MQLCFCLFEPQTWETQHIPPWRHTGAVSWHPLWAQGSLLLCPPARSGGTLIPSSPGTAIWEGKWGWRMAFEARKMSTDETWVVWSQNPRCWQCRSNLRFFRLWGLPGTLCVGNLTSQNGKVARKVKYVIGHFCGQAACAQPLLLLLSHFSRVRLFVTP